MFPLLSEGGIYIVEDTHTSYWWKYGGGFAKKKTAIGLAKRLIDDLHAWYHGKAQPPHIGGIHIYDSIIVIEKRTARRPGNVIIEQRRSDNF